MTTSLQNAGANLPASDFAPIHVNRMVTGMWSNSNPLRDAAVPLAVEKYMGGRSDRIKDGNDCEISVRLTLRRRPGMSVYNSQTFPRINRYYAWNTFSLNSENVRVMVDTATAVYDATSNATTPNQKINIWTKSPGAGSTYFLGVGNTLYFTNGVDNKQLSNATGVVWNWGIAAPPNAPLVTQNARPTVGPSWTPNMAFSLAGPEGAVLPIIDTNNNIQVFVGAPSGLSEVPFSVTPSPAGTTGNAQPNPWNVTVGGSTTDGTITWHNSGSANWAANHSTGDGQVLAANTNTTSGTVKMFFINIASGLNTTGTTVPQWPSGVGATVQDGTVLWQNIGAAITWDAIGPLTPITNHVGIVDPNGYTQLAITPGKTGPTVPAFQTELGAYTLDGSMQWKNTGPFAPAGTGAVQYGYAFGNSIGDISNMSRASYPITVSLGNEVTVQGAGSTDPQTTIIYLYRTAQGGSTFLLLTQFANTGSSPWTFVDTLPDSSLNPEIQAQVSGEGTPPPAGGTCMEYHLGRIWIASGNVVYGSSGPDAVVAGASGNAGFDLSFTAQSKVVRLWSNSLGLFVFTVRDAYVILQDATTGTLYMQKWVENVPLLSYDAFCVLLTTPHLFTGYRTVVTLDSGAGIVEMSFPVADKVALLNPASAYCTFMMGPSGETALYLSDGQTLWYRMAPTSAPETGINWSPAAHPAGGMSAVQATEINPGQMALLVGPGTSGPILMRDTTKNTDNGVAYTAQAYIGSVVLALPGQLAGLAWMTLEAEPAGTAPALGVLLDEISGTFQHVRRTRQDPTNLPPSASLYSNRHSLLQSQRPVWCRHMQYSISWPAEDAANELLTTTIFGQVWQEQRSQ